MFLRTTRVTVCVVICAGSLAAQTAQSPVESVVQRNKAPQWTAHEKARGFVVCTDHWMRPMLDVFAPTREQIVDELSCALARGEYESLQVGVHALKDLGPVKMTVELDLPVQAYRFLYSARELTIPTSPGEDQRLLKKQPVKLPYYLFPEAEHKQVDVRTGHGLARRGKTVGFWITIQAPAQAAPGVHRGVVRITANGQEIQLPLQVTVRDFVLPRPDIAFGMYFDFPHRFPKDYSGPKYERMYYEDMAAHGMNSVTVARPALWDPEGHFNEAQMTEKFTMMAEAGLLDGTQPVMHLSAQWDAKKLRSRAAEILAELRRLERRYDWPHILVYGYDEPKGNFDAIIEIMRPWVEAGCEFITAFTSRDAIRALAPSFAATVVVPPEMHEYVKKVVEEAGSELWTYDCHTHGYSPIYMRCYAGLFSWNAGVKGNFVWAYTHSHSDYYTDTVQPNGTGIVMVQADKASAVTVSQLSFTRAVPGPKGPIPTIGWEARREGVDDYRYLQLLRDTAAAPDADPTVVGEVNQWFETLKSLVVWHHLPQRFQDPVNGRDFIDPYAEVTPQRYDQIRSEAANFVMRLRKAVP